MPRDLILGTAGHIDHGKTALVAALTGTPGDRLPEEKRRGITIDLGFTHLTVGEVCFGLVDVPGHERFIRNMLAGAVGCDAALVVVSATESVRPQTVEHVRILHDLGVRQGVIALTKADLADAARQEQTIADVRALVRDTFLADAPIVVTSARTGMGLDALRAILATFTRATGPELPFRLAVDRSFTVAGHGTVVTGTVASGRLRVGDEVEWLPSGKRLRVRGLHRHDSAVSEVTPGQRAAVNVVGASAEEMERGHELASPGYLKPSTMLTVRVTAFERTWKHRLPVRVHVGTAETMATLLTLADGWAQLDCEHPVMTMWGQRVILRDASAEHTLGGGIVMQPNAVRLRRTQADLLARLTALEGDDRAVAAAWFAGFDGLHAVDALRTIGMPSPDVTHPERIAQAEELLLTALGKLHAEQPLAPRIDRAQLSARLEHVGSDAFRAQLIERLVLAGKVVADARTIARTDLRPKLSANQQKQLDAIIAAHASAGLQPPEPGPKEGELYTLACAAGLLVKVSDTMYLHPTTAVAVQTQLVTALTAHPAGLTMAALRDALGTTRKYAVPLGEYFDRIGVTRRVGDVRVLRSA